jgi:acyl-CoA reductase-like NAD-dependent aldehyde dehydrogenase
MTDHYPMLLARDVEAVGRLDVRAPFDGQVLGSVDLGGTAAVEAALDVAYQLFRNRDLWLPPAERIAVLRRTARLMEERAETLATEAAREGGKPLLDSRVEVARAIDGVLNCAELMRFDAGNVIPMNINAASADRVAFTQREPVGVVVAVSAFNHPLNLIVHQVGPAIAAGCPVIVKPAGDTPLSCMRFVGLLREAGLPAEWCQALVTASNDISTALVCDARVGFFSFIGSSRVGWMLRSKLAPGARCALEHGGAAPVIVAADADLEMASAKLAKGGFYHAGQVCVSVQRVFAHRSAVMVNDHTAFRVDWMPFAGLKESGLGVGGIPYTFREMQVDKMFVGSLPSSRPML